MQQTPPPITVPPSLLSHIIGYLLPCTNHPKIQWLKTTLLFSLMILPGGQVQLGGSSAPSMLAGEAVVLGPDWAATSSMAHPESWPLRRNGQNTQLSWDTEEAEHIFPLRSFRASPSTPGKFGRAVKLLQWHLRAPQMGKHLLPSLPRTWLHNWSNTSSGTFYWLMGLKGPAQIQLSTRTLHALNVSSPQ